ncbi:MAG: 50S ribosomal protein L18 [Candidatus Glassbacteria bacterium]
MHRQKNLKELLRTRRHKSVRKRIFGTQDRPRLVVHRSNKSIQAHLVDDVKGVIMLGVSSLSRNVIERLDKKSTKTQVSRMTGQVLAEIAKSKGIEKVVFDRGGHLYHGRVKALAEGARDGGLVF